MTRALQQELRSVRKRVENTGDPELEKEDIELITDGLSAEDPRTQRQAVRVLQSSPDPEIKDLQASGITDGLKSVIKRGIEDEGDRERRNAQRAARVFGQIAIHNADVAADVAPLAERMLEISNPHLRTGGAALVIPAMILEEYTLDRDSVEHITQHIFLTDELTESYETRVDRLSPPLLALSKAESSHADHIAEALKTVNFGPYIGSPHDQIKPAVTDLLNSLAESHPEFVEPYLLDLTIRLRDDNPQVVLKAGRTLATLGDTTGVDVLRPTLYEIATPLERDELPALAGALSILSTIAEQHPPWFDDVPIDAIDALREREEIESESELRASIATVLSSYALAEDSTLIDSSVAEFILGTATAADDPTDVLPYIRELKESLARTLIVDSNTILPVVATAGSDSSLMDATSQQLAASVIHAFEDADHIHELPDVDVEPPTESDRLIALQYLIAKFGIRSALKRESTVFTQVCEQIRDTERPVWERRVLAEALAGITTDALTESQVKTINGVAETLKASDDEALSEVGMRLQTD